MIWFLLAPLDFLVGLLAFPLAPLIVLLTTPAGTSPAWAWPWLTHDNPIDGDYGHMLRWQSGGSRWRIYCRRVAWLWRNRGYGFSYRVAGKSINGQTHFVGDRLVGDSPMHPGVCWATNGNAWQLYAFFPWWRAEHIGLRVRLGWSIPLSIDSPNERAMLKLHINPFFHYS